MKNQEKSKPMLNLKLMRIRKGFTLITLAEKAGVNYNSISQWENGIHVPRAEKLQALAEALECDVKNILDCKYAHRRQGKWKR